ncbi:cob(I)yrinic acid a,c-diamide adenosyltransferase [Bacillus clarus]|uniref:Corrinoid adenosyltransferase n=1 Tax=Bacillus clarus TaxID=2338372 RepID=A0A090YZU1_9BACI|nr:cob(I)yrinic acid a,c-diamide adenosyltransferase [Bacillus clarus]KFN03907.1 cob(I)yrinic acid a,c-diamide adenosyltransferase [Bacillus clarus]RFT68342.1 cob(I)yrinic acid a,c-diamide adenosyltransferase [Bacillus clarus]
MKLYTKTGDKGQTSVIGGRVDKNHIRVEAYGTIDEVNSHIGYAMTMLQDESFRDIYNELENIQHELFDCGGDLATVQQKIPYKVIESMITNLEERIDNYIEEAPPLERFILPGGSGAAAMIHVARTVTRRAERCIVSLGKQEETNEIVLKYVNRLSDYLFAIARVINARLQIKDVEYNRSAIVFRNKEEREVE